MSILKYYILKVVKCTNLQLQSKEASVPFEKTWWDMVRWGTMGQQVLWHTDFHLPKKKKKKIYISVNKNAALNMKRRYDHVPIDILPYDKLPRPIDLN